ncbi:MAG: GNAT family N-acetyltransferase [Firmicutes bacterium]|jgi:RimJ/RimL family protein N-acetyltransferase|nr:GNAT family N-acetyltransferase [Bacillota bacterium]
MCDGETVLLRQLAERDLGTMARWDADQELTSLMGETVRTESESRLRFSKLLSDRNSLAMAIVTQDGRLIGDIELTEIAWRSGDAELVVRIGDPDCRGRGMGADAVRAMLGAAFDRLNLARVYLRVCADNRRAIRCYLKCGFRREGVVRRKLGPDGEARRVVLMTIMRSDFARMEIAS